MDPSLQDTTCVCPDPCCQWGEIQYTDGSKAGECVRCDGTGYILCDQLWPGEPKITMAQERSIVWVNVGTE